MRTTYRLHATPVHLIAASPARQHFNDICDSLLDRRDAAISGVAAAVAAAYNHVGNALGRARHSVAGAVMADSPYVLRVERQHTGSRQYLAGTLVIGAILVLGTAAMPTRIDVPAGPQTPGIIGSDDGRNGPDYAAGWTSPACLVGCEDGRTAGTERAAGDTHTTDSVAATDRTRVLRVDARDAVKSKSANTAVNPVTSGRGSGTDAGGTPTGGSTGIVPGGNAGGNDNNNGAPADGGNTGGSGTDPGTDTGNGGCGCANPDTPADDAGSLVGASAGVGNGGVMLGAELLDQDVDLSLGLPKF